MYYSKCCNTTPPLLHEHGHPNRGVTCEGQGGVGVIGQNVIVLPMQNWNSIRNNLTKVHDALKFASMLFHRKEAHPWCKCGSPWPTPFHLHWAPPCTMIRKHPIQNAWKHEKIKNVKRVICGSSTLNTNVKDGRHHGKLRMINIPNLVCHPPNRCVILGWVHALAWSPLVVLR